MIRILGKTAERSEIRVKDGISVGRYKSTAFAVEI